MIKKGINSGPKHGKILGVGLTSTSRTRVLAFVRQKLTTGKKFFIATPNSEILVQAQHDGGLFRALEKADIALPDGVGVILASKLFGRKLKLIKGREMFVELVRLANKKGWRAFLLGGANGVARECASVLSKTFKKVKFEFADGPILNKNGVPVSEVDSKIQKDVIDKINKFTPQILFVAFGAPKQEKWTLKWLPELKIGGAMVVGGTFDYVSGRKKLPPGWLDRLGLEWLWRLIRRPRHIIRVIRATLVFPLYVLLWGSKRKSGL